MTQLTDSDSFLLGFLGIMMLVGSTMVVVGLASDLWETMKKRRGPKG